MKKRTIRYSLLLLALIWMALIFGFSSQTGKESGGLSALIAEPLTDWLFRLVEGTTQVGKAALYSKVDHLVRKTAHFSEYAILGMLLTGVLRAFGVKKAWLPLLLGALYAVTDEWHQMYSPGRTGKVMDILIDAAGVMTGVLIYHFARKIWRRFHVHHQGTV